MCLIYITSASEFWHIDSFNRLICILVSIAMKATIHVKLYLQATKL
nr:MAG TPA: hypothetical protein [Caudoviricetes sp.]